MRHARYLLPERTLEILAYVVADWWDDLYRHRRLLIVYHHWLLHFVAGGAEDIIRRCMYIEASVARWLLLLVGGVRRGANVGRVGLVHIVRGVRVGYL
jgi:hypothetical protein